MTRMTNEEALDILERYIKCDVDNCPEPEMSCIECPYNVNAIDYARACKMAIEALSKQCASTEQVGKDIKFPTIHCCRGYDCIKDENGRMGFGVYDPKEKNIYIAGDIPKEIFLKALFHEIFHWVQDVTGMKFDEDDANSFSYILYDAVDMFDDHGPELFGQKAIVEPGEVFVGDKVLKEALDDQFRDSAKKTDSERVSLSEQEKSNSFSKEPSESSDSEMNCSDVPDFHAGKTNFQPGDKFILELGQERRMFGEFEIAGTDLYVKTDLLEKLTRYEPGENPGNLGENPGIIRCNAYKYWIQTVGRMQGYGLGKCDFHDANLVNCNGFCYWAERRNDG